MNITAMLRKWLQENCGVKEDATDLECKTAAGVALAEGKLTAEKWAELTVDSKEKEANEFAQKLDRIADGLAKVVTAMEAKETPKAETKEVKVGDGTMEKKVADIGSKQDARVKGATEGYSTVKSELRYPTKSCKGSRHTLAGQVAQYPDGRTAMSASDRDKAMAGVWAKFQIATASPRIAGSPQRAWEMMSDHEKGLLTCLADEEDWDDSLDYRPRRRKGYPGGIKALIDDAASGGLEAAPIVFDDLVIQAPLLNGELYPLVREVPLDRGRRVEGVSTGTVTGSWGGVDNTAITLFATAAYVAAFDTTVYRWEGAIELGLDFLSDTPIDFGAHITAQYGERLLEDLDDVIATGNGTTQPEGIMNHAAVTAVAFGGATSLTAYETLRFSVSKQEHKSAAGTVVFCGTETSYRRAIGIPIGAADARRVFEAVSGPNYDGYSILQRPYKINGSLANTQIFYAIMNKYRMYRRKGLTVRTSTEGQTNIRGNKLLIVVMARYGGQLERAACAALTTTAPA